jgi:hypothetical protein
VGPIKDTVQPYSRDAYELNDDGNRRMVTDEGLEEQAAALEDATMPNGQRYEDWPKAERVT